MLGVLDHGYLLGHFHSLGPVQGSTSTGVFEGTGGCQILTNVILGFPFRLSFFMAIERRTRVTTSVSIVNLEFGTV